MSTWELDEEHVQFQAVCRRFVDEHVQPLVADAERSGRFPDELWPKLADAGLLGLQAPEEHGGSGGDALAIVILAEELAKACGGIAITPLVSSYMAGSHIVRFGRADQRDRYVPLLTGGKLVVAIAVTEPGAGSDVAGIASVGKRVDGGYVLRGTKMFITNAGFADLFIVAVKTDPTAARRGITTFLVDRSQPGLQVGSPLPKIGWRSSDTREVILDDCFVPEDQVLGAVGHGFYQIMAAFQLERLVLAAMGLGHAQSALDEACAYARTRHAFGAALSSRQTIRHRLAAMQIDVHAARLITYRASVRLDAGHPDAEQEVAMAKYYAAQAATRVTDEAVQVFGGSGYIDDTPVARHYRDARILRIGGGTDEIQLEILAKRMGL